MTKAESAATDSSHFSATVPGLPGGNSAVVADYELHCAGQGGIDLMMGFRLFLADKDAQTTHIFREAAFRIKSELFLYESLGPAKQAIQAERFDVFFAEESVTSFLSCNIEGAMERGDARAGVGC